MAAIRLTRRTAASLWVGVLALCAHGACLAAAADDSPATAFTHVNVIPLDAERVLPDQTVLVEHGKIIAISPHLTPPAGAVVINGDGAFLSPGLADMHTHSDTRADLVVYLANGVTTMLNMGEASHSFVGRTKPAANRGDIPAPHIYTALRIDGSARYGSLVVATPSEARMAVRLAKSNGNDFIKVYNDLAADTFEALVKETRRLGMPIVGHGITRVGLRRQLAAGQLMVAHAEEFLYTVFESGDADDGTRAPDDAQIPAVVEMIKRSHAFVTADLVTYATIARQWGKPAVVDDFLGAPDSRYVSPQDRMSWKLDDYVQRKGSLDERLKFLGRFVKAMSDAGVPLITGTDAPAIPGVIPGYALHDDLDLLRQAGLTPYQALLAATRTPGKMLQRRYPDAAPFGTVAVGSRADLILSAANPLDDLDTLRRPLGVMAAGKWYAHGRLQELLDTVAKRYQDAAYPIPASAH
ncbi:amidohydrolase family protein [Duganella sp. FT3S]|uniref:Amidohydrolase family protein n=1 Tax=Rugamonas fusca TaxID=2758568 RepID=A0A7W2EG07_9BURK|nr:amidohydrolase family protein [Rugamonas fusca]MBA5605156.1 amidohydrolase family protein [Rugamonas fusca]